MKIYNWNELSIGHKTFGSNDSPHIRWEPMPPDIQAAAITDTATGEVVPEVLAYDSHRKLVDRVLLNANGRPFVRADYDDVAMVTESRELTITPREVSAEDAIGMIEAAKAEDDRRTERRRMFHEKALRAAGGETRVGDTFDEAGNLISRQAS